MRFRRQLLGVLLTAVVMGFACAGQSLAQGTEATIPSIELSGEISPATADWVGTALDDATAADAPIAIIRLDTPGGLDSSMREIVKDIIAAPMPVVVYVAPSGARAASAGVFITEAADVAAMAPETNIGSASPISSTGEDLGDTLGRKITNDAAAFVRALATSHGRNPELAEQMVREATNVTSVEALEAGLIDIVASDEEDLLKQLNGFKVQGPKAVTLQTAGLNIEQRDMPLQYDLLQILVNPNVAFVLLLVGLLGITLEVFAPGTIIPGAVGVIALVLGLIGTIQLPIAAIGVVLLIAGIALIIAEAHLPTGGLLGIAGVAALIGGGLMIFDTNSDEFSISPALVIAVGGTLGIGTIFIGRKAMQARHRPVATGQEELLGSIATVRTALDPVGQVFVEGALWKARTDSAAGPLRAGYRVKVEEIDGLTLVVSPHGDAPVKPTGAVGSETEGVG